MTEEKRNKRMKNNDYLSLTEIARYKNLAEPKDAVANWMQLRDTIEFLGMWEYMKNPDFKLVAYEEFRKEADKNDFRFSPKKWIETTGAIGIESRSGKGGGIYAHEDIVIKFTCWISVEFQLYFIKEFQRMKESKEGPEWTVKREFANIGMVMR